MLRLVNCIQVYTGGGGEPQFLHLSTHGLHDVTDILYLHAEWKFRLWFVCSNITTLRFRPESMMQHLFKCLQAGKMEPISTI